MRSPVFSAYRQDTHTIFRRALDAVDPYRLVQEALEKKPGMIEVRGRSINLHDFANIYLIAIGKAARGMAHAFLESSQIEVKAGLITLPTAERAHIPPQMQSFHAGHPHPNQASLQAGGSARDLLAGTKPNDLVVVLISGGGSAMFELPLPGIQLEALRFLNQQLVLSGLPINAINLIRGAISQVKAGGLARLAYPARVVSLILSDVIGDRLSAIASGPTVLMPDRRQEARQLLHAKRIWQDLPESVRLAFTHPSPAHQKARRPLNLLIGGNRQLITAAHAAATNLGYKALIHNLQLRGEARVAGERFARRLVRHAAITHQATCFIMGGETTVTVRGSGMGGRNQEFALSAARVLSRHGHIALASLASDGIDGPTDAAGGIIDGETWTRMKSSSFDPARALDENNSYAALHRGEALFRSGPTGTNVADLVLGFVYPDLKQPNMETSARV